jgi:hypothetical protein
MAGILIALMLKNFIFTFRRQASLHAPQVRFRGIITPSSTTAFCIRGN